MQQRFYYDLKQFFAGCCKISGIIARPLQDPKESSHDLGRLMQKKMRTKLQVTKICVLLEKALALSLENDGKKNLSNILNEFKVNADVLNPYGLHCQPFFLLIRFPT